MKQIVYPVLARKALDSHVVLEAGIKNISNQKLEYEGFDLPLPNKISQAKELLFDIMAITCTDSFYKTFAITVHGNFPALINEIPENVPREGNSVLYTKKCLACTKSGDVSIEFSLTLDMLKRWCGLEDDRIIRESFGNTLRRGFSDALLKKLPSQIQINPDEIIVKVHSPQYF